MNDKLYRELDKRENMQETITLLWEPFENSIAVRVEDKNHEDLTSWFYPPNHEAMECFNHPYAYEHYQEIHAHTLKGLK